MLTSTSSSADQEEELTPHKLRRALRLVEEAEQALRLHEPVCGNHDLAARSLLVEAAARIRLAINCMS